MAEGKNNILVEKLFGDLHHVQWVWVKVNFRDLHKIKTYHVVP